MSEGAEPPELLALLDDEYARAILTKTSVKPMSASTLSDRCDASLPTIYRHLERLREYDLLSEQTELVPDGNHYSVYAARLERLEVTLEDVDQPTMAFSRT
ncbi:helix-turn-helix domain-containing protein [Saliphagus sp. GCM10025317]